MLRQLKVQVSAPRRPQPLGHLTSTHVVRRCLLARALPTTCRMFYACVIKRGRCSHSTCLRTVVNNKAHACQAKLVRDTGASTHVGCPFSTLQLHSPLQFPTNTGCRKFFGNHWISRSKASSRKTRRRHFEQGLLHTAACPVRLPVSKLRSASIGCQDCTI